MAKYFVKAWRESLSLTQTTLCERTARYRNGQEMKLETLRKIENGKTLRPQQETLNTIAKALGLLRADLLSPPPSKDILSENEVLTVFTNEQTLFQYVISLMIEQLQNHQPKSIIFPTGRTASTLFSNIISTNNSNLFRLLSESHLFIDTETFGVSDTHSTSRVLQIHASLLSPLKNMGYSLYEENLHFISGLICENNQFSQIDAALRLHPPILHIAAFSPYGEFIGYPCDHYVSEEQILRAGTHVTRVSEYEKNYIDANQLSTSIITIGLRNCFNSKKLIVIVLDEDKADILQSICNGLISPSIPATMILRHKNISVLTTQKIADRLKV